MKLSFKEIALDGLKDIEGAVVVPVAGDGSLSGASEAADTLLNGAIRRAIDTSRFHAKHGDTLEYPVPAGTQASRIVIVGMGLEKLTPTTARKLGGRIGSALGRLDESGATVFADALGSPAMIAELSAGIKMRRYAFNKYKTQTEGPTDRGPGNVVVAASDVSGAEKAFINTNALAEGTAFTRDLVSEPANVLYPSSFAERLLDLGELGVEVEVLNEDKLEELGMGSLLAVGLGSERESHVVVMKWLGADDKSAAPFCAVGKGVTFDTGGISIKPAGGMEEMTMDMGGAGVVSGLMKTVAMRKAKANVIGVVGLVENMPDGKATRPGDIVTAMSGKTIEIINTDAEGRLVLADVLYYAQREFKPRATINLATLTGAIIIALGNSRAGFFSNNDALSDQITAAAKEEDEGIWRMPLGKDYDDLIKSSLADIKNTGGRAAGSATAAQFLQRFVDDSPWAHIDIAGVTLSKEAKALYPKGASGWGVATLNRLVRDQFEN